MRRTALLVCVFALLLAGFGGPALAAPQRPNATFALECEAEGITASGTVAGWYGMLRIQEATGTVAVPSVAVLFSFTQETYVNGVSVGTGERDLPGVRPPGTVYGCEATMAWDYLGLHYYAELSEMEVLFARSG
jgi:hypothetical protein